jgi:serine/threonine protein kinase
MSPDMAEPTIIGKYKIEGRLGQGGMGAVYLARDARIGRLVALKVLRLDNEEMRKRFELEAQSAGRLKHPNIVTIYDYEEYDGNPCLVMEYVEGHTLAEMIQRGDPLPIGRRLDFVEQVCRGLAYAHSAGIVHRDIKPSNLMVDQHGVLKILDFGIARNAERGLTRSRRMVGTAGYMSPEQVRGDKVDQRCDVFAVGLVLYEFLTGRRAFPGENEYSVFDRILNGSPDPFEYPDERVFEGITPILDTALARLPEQRYQSATALGTDLANLRQRFESTVDPQATVVGAMAKAPTPRPSDDRPPLSAPLRIVPTPPPLESDHTPDFDVTRTAAAQAVPASIKTAPVATPAPMPTPAPAPTPTPTATATRSRSRSIAITLAVASWVVLASVVGIQYLRPLLNGGGPAAEPNGTAPSTPAAAAPPPSPAPAPTPAATDTAKPSAPVASAPVAADPAPAPPKPAAPPPRPSVANELARAEKAFEAVDYAEAIRWFEAALKIDPGNALATEGLSTVRRAMQAEQRVLNAKAAPRVLSPEQQKLLLQHLNDGKRLFDDGEYDGAIKAYQSALSLEPADKRATDGIAQAQKAKAAEAAIFRRKPPL